MRENNAKVDKNKIKSTVHVIFCRAKITPVDDGGS